MTVFSENQTPISTSDFAGKKIKQLIIVIFKDGLSVSQWKEVFKDTSRMSFLRSEMERMNQSLVASGARTQEDQNLYLSYLSETTDILIKLYDGSAAYLLSWTDSENCGFSGNAAPSLICGPASEGNFNPMNGGMPSAMGAIQVKRVGKEQSYSAVIPLHLESQEYGNFNLELRLKPEVNSFERFYMGDAFVQDGSSFVKEGTPMKHFQYGYVELRF